MPYLNSLLGSGPVPNVAYVPPECPGRGTCPCSLTDLTAWRRNQGLQAGYFGFPIQSAVLSSSLRRRIRAFRLRRQRLGLAFACRPFTNVRL